MKEQNTQPEAINVEEVVGKSEAFINKYKKQILAAIAAIVVIVAGTILYQDYVVEPKAKAAAAAIFQAEKYFAAQEFDKALNGDEQGNMGLIQVIDEFGGTPTANIANAYAGLALAQTGRYEEAIPYLKAFDGDDNMVAPGVLSALGNCYANTGDLSAARELWLDVMNGGVICGECLSRQNNGLPLPDTDAYESRNILLPLDSSALEAMRYVISAPPQRLFAFGLKDERSMSLFCRGAESYLLNHLERDFDALRFYNSIKD